MKESYSCSTAVPAADGMHPESSDWETPGRTLISLAWVVYLSLNCSLHPGKRCISISSTSGVRDGDSEIPIRTKESVATNKEWFPEGRDIEQVRKKKKSTSALHWASKLKVSFDVYVSIPRRHWMCHIRYTGNIPEVQRGTVAVPWPQNLVGGTRYVMLNYPWFYWIWKGGYPEKMFNAEGQPQPSCKSTICTASFLYNCKLREVSRKAKC